MTPTQTLRQLKSTWFYSAYEEYLTAQTTSLMMTLINTDASKTAEIARLQWHITWLQELYMTINRPWMQESDKAIKDSNDNKINYYWNVFKGILK